jgi:hypothetical protein
MWRTRPGTRIGQLSRPLPLPLITVRVTCRRAWKDRHPCRRRNLTRRSNMGRRIRQGLKPLRLRAQNRTFPIIPVTPRQSPGLIPLPLPRFMALPAYPPIPRRRFRVTLPSAQPGDIESAGCFCFCNAVVTGKMRAWAFPFGNSSK